MNEDRAWELLENQRVIVLDDWISHETFEMIAYAALRFPDDEITIWCSSNGGDGRSGDAIAELIGLHGKFVGVLIGSSMSAAVSVFAACQTRYIANSAVIGLHTTASQDDGRLDAPALRTGIMELEHADLMQAELLQKASSRNAEKWLEIIQSAPHRPCRILTAQEVIEVGLAQPLSDYKMPKKFEASE